MEEAEQSLDLLEKSIIEETMQRKQLDEKLNKKMDQLEGAFLQNAYLLITNDKEYHFVYLLGYEENTYYLMDLFQEEIVYPYSFYETSSYLYPITDYLVIFGNDNLVKEYYTFDDIIKLDSFLNQDSLTRN